MTEYQESCAAKFVLEMAQDYAINIVDDVQDHAAATAAILIRALELATPDLSPQRRASLFCDIDAMLQEEREACAIAALNAPIKTANQPIREACANAIRARNEII